MTRPSLERIRKTLCVLSGALLTAALFGGYGVAQVATRTAPSGGEDASRQNSQDNPAARQADAWFENYQFRDGETLERVRIHYATLGNPHRNGHGRQPGLTSIRANVLALNFSDDEFNPSELRVLDRPMPRVPHGRFIAQEGSETSYGHLTMAHPELWSQHVAKFMHELGDTSPQTSGR
jgi:hypothetical protein